MEETKLMDILHDQRSAVAPETLIKIFENKGYAPKDVRVLVQRALKKGLVTLNEDYCIQPADTQTSETSH
ncbi:hypothetical protein [Cohaesibacter haloalkalitolerans]|uniref:hypothetical protein n=1 Tax=Cohaesibacter haloalkalitolerans TaxID=1162980 RepID=UPI0013C476C5|nr:hypothetical protein [Cohaesibacter haloalkalitolerans]